MRAHSPAPVHDVGRACSHDQLLPRLLRTKPRASCPHRQRLPLPLSCSSQLERQGPLHAGYGTCSPAGITYQPHACQTSPGTIPWPARRPVRRGSLSNSFKKVLAIGLRSRSPVQNEPVVARAKFVGVVHCAHLVHTSETESKRPQTRAIGRGSGELLIKRPRVAEKCGSIGSTVGKGGGAGATIGSLDSPPWWWTRCRVSTIVNEDGRSYSLCSALSF
jgi:hypothetical protein